MFINVYKTTIKNLVRSVTFWIMLAVLIIISVHDISIASFGKYNTELNEIIYDTDPRFILDYRSAIQKVINSLSGLLSYIVPIFVITTTTLILNRDYNDKFYEIEKSANMKPMSYLLGRLTALISVNFVVTTIMHFFVFYTYVQTRGGIEGMTNLDYLYDTFGRLLRLDIYIGLPCVIFFVTLSYFLGTVFKNGLMPAIIGMSYTIFCYIHDMFNVANTGVFMDYFKPNPPQKLFYYLYYYDTEWFEWMKETFSVSFSQALYCVIIIAVFSIIFTAISYLRVKNRYV